MNNCTVVCSSRARDTYQCIKHSSGLTIYLYPKENASTAYAVFGTKYGSIDTCFQRSDENSAQQVPEGIAHYLEHKLFESEDGDAFQRYAKTGANANAFTSFESTCYVFSCSDHLYESLEILLDFVQSPYFTEENVQKEQGIISQEIKMYDDDPQWRVMFNYLRAMYHSHPVRTDIAGTVESIAEITPELLYRCYYTFYNLHNMVLSLCGNFDAEKVIALCDRMLKPSKAVQVKRIFSHEPDSVVNHKIEEQLPISTPVFQFGYKEPVCAGSYRSEKQIAAMEVALDILISDASPLFRELLDKELINEASFSYEYFEGAGYATVMFGGESKKPEVVAEMIQREIARIKENGIVFEDFQRAKKSLYGDNISALNSTAAIANALASFSFKDRELFAYLDALAELTTEDVQDAFTALNAENTVLSVIKPLK